MSSPEPDSGLRGNPVTRGDFGAESHPAAHAARSALCLSCAARDRGQLGPSPASSRAPWELAIPGFAP